MYAKQRMRLLERDASRVATSPRSMNPKIFCIQKENLARAAKAIR
jgi:hypothetical protein